jgi:predicted transport protein
MNILIPYLKLKADFTFETSANIVCIRVVLRPKSRIVIKEEINTQDKRSTNINGLFKDAVNIGRYVVANVVMISEQETGYEAKAKGRGLVLI